MRHPESVIDIFLQPGEIYCADGGGTRIRTLLGSCVSITCWHPKKIGAMCHLMLPSRRRHGELADDARYADEALPLLLRMMAEEGAALAECEIKLFGGGNMFTSPDDPRQPAAGERRLQLNVAQKNV